MGGGGGGGGEWAVGNGAGGRCRRVAEGRGGKAGRESSEAEGAILKVHGREGHGREDGRATAKGEVGREGGRTNAMDTEA